MKRVFRNFAVILVGTFVITSCAKKEGEYGVSKESAAASSSVQEGVLTEEQEAVSMAANQEVEGKKFVRKAGVNMEVSDVYQSTVYIENALKEMGGFVTLSNYQSLILEENTYPLSDEKSILVRKYSSSNSMQVRVPAEKLSDFLIILNDKSVFLRDRTITAEDVSSNIKMAELEKQRMAKHKSQLSQQANTTKNAEAVNENEREINQQKIEELNLADELKYSTVDIYLSEPKYKISQIEIPNTTNQEKQYMGSFTQDVKEGFVNGFYGFQKFLVLAVQAWMFILAGVLGIFVWRNRKKFWKKSNKKEEQK